MEPGRANLDLLTTCPAPAGQYSNIVLGHGSGGRLTADLIRHVFVPAFRNEVLAALEDQAVVAADSSSSRIAISTDSFVVRPIFFPGGDIGCLAVNGAINDLAVGGAQPMWLAAAFVLEEGLPLADLQRIVESMHNACTDAGVQLVAGDTKVVDRGKGDLVYITATCIGIVPPGVNLSIRSAQPGDKVLVSGTIGDHGIAIMSVREGIEFDTVIESDTAALTGLARALLETGARIRCMRDPTRGGLASALNELAEGSGVGVKIDEAALPVRPEVRAACELLGLDPLYVANEGKVMVIAADIDAERVLAALRRHPRGNAAAIIGEVVTEHAGMVTMRTVVGGERIIPMLAGEQLPRIC